MRTKILIAAIAAVAVGFVLPGTASAAPDALYCLNGVSTTLPVGVSFTGGTATLSGRCRQPSSSASVRTFYAGTSGGRAFVATATAGVVPLDPGYSTNFVSLGSCTAFAPAITYVSVCKYLPRADGTLGLFQQIKVPDSNDSKGQYYDAVAANWVEGLGLACDDPVALGYRATNTFVAWGGKPAPDHDAKGVRGSGFNDIRTRTSRSRRRQSAQASTVRPAAGASDSSPGVDWRSRCCPW